MEEEMFLACRLCPRECGVNRQEGERGVCGESVQVRAARAALHWYEEPCLVGSRGSGAVFFSGCPLRCIYCQNQDIALSRAGKVITVSRLAEIFLELQEKGAANINLVTASHFAPQVVRAVRMAREKGMCLPIVYNSSGYEKIETLRLLEGTVDIYLPDLKYMEEDLAEKFSRAPDYPERAKKAITEMVRQTGPFCFDEDGMLVRGTMVRHLVLPAHTANSKKVLSWLYKGFGKRILYSLMSQYTPVTVQKDYPELNRRLTRREYQKVVDYAMALGIEDGYFQEGRSAQESFIPAFDYEGL